MYITHEIRSRKLLEHCPKTAEIQAREMALLAEYNKANAAMESLQERVKKLQEERSQVQSKLLVSPKQHHERRVKEISQELANLALEREELQGKIDGAPVALEDISRNKVDIFLQEATDYLTTERDRIESQTDTLIPIAAQLLEGIWGAIREYKQYLRLWDAARSVLKGANDIVEEQLRKIDPELQHLQGLRERNHDPRLTAVVMTDDGIETTVNIDDRIRELSEARERIDKPRYSPIELPMLNLLGYDCFAQVIVQPQTLVQHALTAAEKRLIREGKRL